METMKKMYVAPASEIVELRYSGILCGSQKGDGAYREVYGGAIELSE
ncbi:MAG: hypothetical protein J6W47_02460 [Bacteroidales bacterium]|jgi:hypothetical protein|nr:hypothetical protein [Bacteroidales bacterium]